MHLIRAHKVHFVARTGRYLYFVTRTIRNLYVVTGTGTRNPLVVTERGQDPHLVAGAGPAPGRPQEPGGAVTRSGAGRAGVPFRPNVVTQRCPQGRLRPARYLRRGNPSR